MKIRSPPAMMGVVSFSSINVTPSKTVTKGSANRNELVTAAPTRFIELNQM